LGIKEKNSENGSTFSSKRDEIKQTKRDYADGASRSQNCRTLLFVKTARTKRETEGRDTLPKDSVIAARHAGKIPSSARFILPE
jgi:hypothetical protein